MSARSKWSLFCKIWQQIAYANCTTQAQLIGLSRHKRLRNAKWVVL